MLYMKKEHNSSSIKCIHSDCNNECSKCPTLALTHDTSLLNVFEAIFLTSNEIRHKDIFEHSEVD